MLVCVIFVIKGVPGAPGLFSVLLTLSGVSVKPGTGPEHFRNTLRTSRNTPEQPPDGPDPPPLPRLGTPSITKIRLKNYKTKKNP